MLWVTIRGNELWDEKTEEFICTESCRLQLEHSLVAISKWESKHCKSFLTDEEKSYEETIDYVRCMTITQNVKDEVYNRMSDEALRSINDYISSPMTATRFQDKRTGRGNKEPITSELIYYWMVSFNIPFECQKWHLNRLLALIRVCETKNNPPKPLSKKELMARNSALNRQRRQQHNTSG